MQLIAALLLGLHGLAHLVGFRAAFWPSPIQLSKTSYLGRKVDGVLWLVLAFGFVATAGLLIAHRESWTTLLLWSAGGSSLMCLMGFISWPAARIGLAIDVLLLVLVLLLSPSNVSS